MEKLPKLMCQLAGALLVLAISIFLCINILLAGMPMLRDVSEQLKAIDWFGINNLISFALKGFIVLFFAVWVTKILFSKKKGPSPESPKNPHHEDILNNS